jgi:outer membrane protein TolC
MYRLLILLAILTLQCGCATHPKPQLAATNQPLSGVRLKPSQLKPLQSPVPKLQTPQPRHSPIQLVSAQEEDADDGPTLEDSNKLQQGDEEASASASEDDIDKEEQENKAPTTTDDDSQTLPIPETNKLSLSSVIDSVHTSFPLVEAAYLDAQIADGKAIAAEGAFDTKLKLSSDNGPTGFYQTYRQKANISRPLFGGGEVFGNYRLGRGDFEPWYEERETNGGGEFKVGIAKPFLRDRDIDARRADLWRANYDQLIAQPEIRGQLIGFSLDASLAYWKWVAEGRKYFAEQDWLELAASRNKQIERRVEEGDLDPPELIDNERAIAKRKAKLADQLRKVQQAGVKLSLYLRDPSGLGVVPTLEQIPDFPEPQLVDGDQLEASIAIALNQRPDLQVVQLLQERLEIDYSEASNLGLPKLDTYLIASQDVGLPTSSLRDKSEFEVDAGFLFEMPIQRRKAIGKMQAIEAKIAQVSAKERFTVDKITAGVTAAFAGMKLAYEQVQQATKAKQLATKMAEIERRKFELGQSDLLKVALREQYAIEAIEGQVAALFNFFATRSNFYAEMAIEKPETE